MQSEWDLDPDFLAVNHGSFGTVPRCVREAQRTWQDRIELQPARLMTMEYPAAIRAATAELGAFLNAAADELAFLENATTGVNAVLRHRSVPFPGGDRGAGVSPAPGRSRIPSPEHRVGRRGNGPRCAPPERSARRRGQHAMGTVRLPVQTATAEAALAIRRDLLRRGSDAPGHALDGNLWLRLSAFAYNRIDDATASPT